MAADTFSQRMHETRVQIARAARDSLPATDGQGALDALLWRYDRAVAQREALVLDVAALTGQTPADVRIARGIDPP